MENISVLFLYSYFAMASLYFTPASVYEATASAVDSSVES
jgi:hypothetical protein